MKAILVIDKSDDYCTSCQLYDKENDYCYGLKRILGDDFWCPLQPLPQNKDDLRYLDSYAKGYNDCIDEILEGENK